MSEEIKVEEEVKDEKPAKAEKPVKAKPVVNDRADGKIAFTKDGVTIWRNKEDACALGLSGWVKK